MTLTSFLQGFAIYAVIWWLVLFAVLPWGARSHAESGEEVVPGTESGAPLRPLLLRKVLATTLVAALIYGGFFWMRNYSGLTFDDMPGFLKYEAAE